MKVCALAGGISLASLRCRCGSPAIAIDPGEPPTIDPETDVMLSRGRPVTGRCLACWSAPKAARVLECWRCAGTSEDGLAFDRRRKPRGRPLLCVECAAEPVPAPPVFVRATYRRHEIARACAPQMDIEHMAGDAHV